MFIVYVLKALVHDRYYVGQTQNIFLRLKKHNSGWVTSTKHFLPWEIVHTEELLSRAEAVAREKYLKSSAGRKWLKKIYA